MYRDRKRYLPYLPVFPVWLLSLEGLIGFAKPSAGVKSTGYTVLCFSSRGIADTFKIVSFDRKAYAGTENGIQLLSLLSLEELMYFANRQLASNLPGTPFYVCLREVFKTSLQLCRSTEKLIPG